MREPKGMMKLWDFALDFYARPGVEVDCLTLQEEGVDVCLLLCCAWLYARGVTYEQQRFETLQDIAHQWQQEVITPLRKLRRSWKAREKHDAELVALRERLKHLELGAEQVLLKRLEQSALPWPHGNASFDAWIGSATGSAFDDTITQRIIERLRDLQ